jgi:hypothetical protein
MNGHLLTKDRVNFLISRQMEPFFILGCSKRGPVVPQVALIMYIPELPVFYCLSLYIFNYSIALLIRCKGRLHELLLPFSNSFLVDVLSFLNAR